MKSVLLSVSHMNIPPSHPAEQHHTYAFCLHPRERVLLVVVTEQWVRTPEGFQDTWFAGGIDWMRYGRSCKARWDDLNQHPLPKA